MGRAWRLRQTPKSAGLGNDCRHALPVAPQSA